MKGEVQGESAEEATLKDSFDPYEVSLKHEEDEAQRRSEEEDREAFEAICKQIKVLMREIVKLKSDKPDGWASDVDTKRTRVLMLMLSLRKLSRVQKVRVKSARDSSVDGRQVVDAVTLQLQNLMYEVSHLNKEVRRCLDFPSADKDIDLVSLKKFYADAPESISRPLETLEDPHQQRLAQLDWELEQRRGQTELFDRLTSERNVIANGIKVQEQKLKQLLPMIDAILKATIPLQDALDLPLEAKREQNAISEHLPLPLSTLWLQASSYASAVDPLLFVTIEGDLEAAIKQEKEKLVEKEAEESDTENDVQEDAARNLRSKKEKSVTTEVEIIDKKLKNLLKQHPLNVNVTISLKDEDSISIRFYYCETLEIVTTKTSMKLKREVKPTHTNILDDGTLLNLLFPDDVGLGSPNPSTEYYLQRAKVPTLTAQHLKEIGRPFKWAQTLSGLAFRSPEKIITVSVTKEAKDPEASMDAKDSETCVDVDSDLEDRAPSPPSICWKNSSDNMHITIKAIRARLQAKLALQEQLPVLEKATCTSAIPLSVQSVSDHFPSKICTEMLSFRHITWAEYDAAPYTKPFRDGQLVDEQCMMYRAEFRRQEASMRALIAISPNYPRCAPSFALCINWNGEQTALNNPDVKQMESEVNVHYADMIPNKSDSYQLICFQLYRLAMCFDILTEAKSVKVDPSEKKFHKEKIFFRPSRGPDRALPFKYIPKLGVFAQR